MGTELKNILFGGAAVYNVEKAGIVKDNKGDTIYCVWLKGGAYAEYPEQTQRNIVSYFAKDKESGITHPITEKTFLSNKTEKDGREFTFFKDVEEYPTLSSEKLTEQNGVEYYKQLINGFNGIKIRGTEHADGIYLSNTKNAGVVTNNDSQKDCINIMVNCKDIQYNHEPGVDEIVRWVGYEKKNGYFGDFKEK